ncbi:MAG: type II toxin-antitoxin system HicA family toxin [bacterium]
MQLTNIPSDTTQKKVLKAFKKIGFIELHFGKGSHRVVQCPKTGARVTVQYKIYKEVVREYCKTVMELGYDIDKFIKKL